jgi:hypothetical protein
MLKAFKYAILPSEEQKHQLAKYFGSCRFVYNIGLETKRQVWAAERRGLVNLSRLFGKSFSRRAVWLKIKLKSATDQDRRLNFGFCDEVWVFLNAQPAFVDKNIYGTPISKQDGRCSLENASFNLPLKAGINELAIGISNDFFGWAIIARLESIDGIEILKD